MPRAVILLCRWWPALAVAGIALGMAAILLSMGRLPICACGSVKLWHGAVQSAENSQHLSDWYAPSHIVHGLLFFAALAWILPRRRIGLRLVIAALVEAAWEIVENTPMVINRYRDATMALGYTGDSVVNSLADLGFMMLGFALAWRLPAWTSVLLGLGLELAALVAIRDNLTLNVLMLLYPLDAVRNWQAGG